MQEPDRFVRSQSNRLPAFPDSVRNQEHENGAHGRDGSRRAACGAAGNLIAH